MRLKSPRVEGGQHRPASIDEESVTFFSVGDADFAAVVLDGEDSPSLSSLSQAELGVLTEVIAGRSNREIACERGTSLRTVTNQVSAVFRKLNVRSRAELALLLAGGGRPEGSEERRERRIALAGSVVAARALAGEAGKTKT